MLQKHLLLQCLGTYARKRYNDKRRWASPYIPISFGFLPSIGSDLCSCVDVKILTIQLTVNVVLWKENVTPIQAS